MRKFIFLFLILLFFFFAQPISASEINKFGIHVTHNEDLIRAAELVNSSGGDWGYVTIVIQENDKDEGKWQNFFDLCREKHLIPLVRLATYLNEDVWEKPALESIADWADFLDSLNWPIKTQYIVVYNEPNQVKEWGGEANPEEYALILDQALTVFKQKNPDFFILNAGFDQAAPNSRTTIEELTFLKGMNSKIPGIFSRLDGWVSHSYPNHGFVGKPWDTGKATIRGYNWELAVLKNNFGLAKELPVFITETGWPHNQSLNKITYEKFYDQSTIVEYTKQAFEDVWLKDEKVVAVTPFILNYPFYPFENFSWLDGEGIPYPQYETVKNIQKVRNEPVQIQKYEVVKFSLPSFLPANFIFKGKISLKNTGQSIWGEKPFEIKSSPSGLKATELALTDERLIKPGETADFDFILKTATVSGDYKVTWEELPEYRLSVFGVGKLTESKDTFFNRILRKILDFWYNL